MVFYFDASALVSLFLDDANTEMARSWFDKNTLPQHISQFCAIEFASAIAIRLRRNDISIDQAEKYLKTFDRWSINAVAKTVITASDLNDAELFVRRFELKFRGPDALHIAICIRLKATMITFDQNQAHAARALGLNVEIPA
jgi:uncharacterized protein